MALAVSAFPDFGFTGAGGRYVLTANTYRGDALTALNDDDAREVPIGFSFPFQGQTWQSVFVNTNGHLTFGAPDAFDFTESVAEFLAGPPRIAALWRDLSPFHGAKILVEHGKDSLNVHYVSMSEFLGETAGTFSTFPNYLSITLHVSGAIHVQWGATTRGQGLVGITPGGGAADPGESDVSSLRSAPATGTTYEIFTGDARSFRFGEDLSDLSFHEIWFRP